jgi:butyryl-CoA dehydrogenase
MIHFELSEDQQQLQDLAARFVENEIKPVAAAVDRVSDPREAFPKDVIRKGFELGFHALLIPEEYGGTGGGTLDYAVLLEELAVGDIGMANAFHVVMANAEMIARMGTPEQRERWLRPIANDTSGEYLVCFGATEPSGGSEIFCPLPDPKLGTRTRATRDGDHYVINGSKVFSSNASVAKLYGLLARNDNSRANTDSCTVFFLPSDTPGFSVGTIEDKMGHRASMNGELIFDNVRLPKENILGREGGGFETLNAIYDTNGVGTGAMAVGLARAAYDAALQYAKEREIWGQPIGRYQAVGHMLADMRADIEMARLMVRRIAWQSTHRDSREGMLPPTMAKVYPAEMARRVTIKAMQIYGGSGYMKDYPLEKYVRDAMVLPIISGANEVLKHFMAQRLLA